jgi:hypothetical protein
MHTRAELAAPCTPDELFAHVDSLERYPAWMALIHDVRVLPDDDGRPAHDVELRARIGPLARSKRLRMVRTVHEPASRVVFERVELDARQHSAWVLEVQLTASGDGARLVMDLTYGGSLWTGGLLERVLADEIERGRDRLLALVSASPRR